MAKTETLARKYVAATESAVSHLDAHAWPESLDERFDNKQYVRAGAMMVRGALHGVPMIWYGLRFDCHYSNDPDLQQAFPYSEERDELYAVAQAVVAANSSESQ
jgi:hypothetical protein